MFTENIVCPFVKRVASILCLRKYVNFQLRPVTTGVGNAPGKETVTGRREQFEHDKQNYQQIFRKRRSDFSGFYSFLIDDGVADAMVAEVTKSIGQKDEPTFIEINPGMGKITKRLMEKGVKKLILYDRLQCFLCQEIFQKYKENIELHKMNYKSLGLAKSTCSFPHDLEICEDKKFIIIGINVSRRFLMKLIHRVMLIDPNYWLNNELYVLISEDVYVTFEITYGPFSKLSCYGCLQLIFDVEILDEFPRSAVTPPTFDDNKKMYFVKFRRKKPDMSAESLIMYWNFVSILTRRKYAVVVAVLERWIPGCGPLLIANGLSVSTEVHELTIKDIHTLYNLVVNHEDFKSAVEILRDPHLISR